MKLEFLGTGAADWNIDNRKDGEFFRRWSSVLVDDTLLIDPGPHIFDYAEKEGKPCLFDGVSAMLVTHSHPDHLNHDTSDAIHKKTGARLFGYKTIDYRARREGREVYLTPLELFKKTDVMGYSVTAFQSNHSTGNPEGEFTYNYLIEKDGRSFYYGCDSGWLMHTAWEAMQKNVPNAVIFELTTGDIIDDSRNFGHTSIPMLEIMIKTFNKKRQFDNTRYYATHLARTLHVSHEDTAERIRPLGVTPVKDGDIIEI